MNKPPHYFQTYPFSCLPACLRMVLAAHGFEITEPELRACCECDETGTRPSVAVKAIIELGFNAYKANLVIEELEELVSNNLNPIVFLRINENAEYSHAVVVYKIVKGKIFFLDPIEGEREIELNKFIEIWSLGLTIIIERN